METAVYISLFTDAFDSETGAGGYWGDTVDDQPVGLSLKEYALLECFIRHPGEVMSREQLSNKVWDFAALTLSNVLDVHMVNLRRKLKTANDSVRFETVRGVGYRLVV